VNIWDSVQRGLEKASNEAGRIARMQRLRAIIDQLTNQQQAQRNLLADKTLELFNLGQITQGELLLVCQELTRLQQQLAQVQQELKFVQSQGPAPTPGQAATSGSAMPITPAYPAYSGGSTLIPPLPPSEERQTLIPPPPPPLEEGQPLMAASNFSTVQVGAYSPHTSEIRYCVTCQTELLPGYAFCHNCGTPVATDAAQPTRRSDTATGEGEHTILRPEGGA
jgi:hypothetical protein